MAQTGQIGDEPAADYADGPTSGAIAATGDSTSEWGSQTGIGGVSPRMCTLHHFVLGIVLNSAIVSCMFFRQSVPGFPAFLSEIVA